MGKFGLFVYLFLIGRFYSHTLGHKGPSQPVENVSNGGEVEEWFRWEGRGCF